MTRLRLLVVWGFLLIALLLRFYFYFSQDPKYKPGEFVSIVTTLYSEPVVKGNTQRFEADGIYIFAPQFPAYHFGDHLRITGKISQGKLSDSEDNVPLKKRPVLMMYFPKINPPAGGEKSSGLDIVGGIGTMRQHTIATIERSLPGVPASLLSGILLGSKEGFSQSFLDALRNTGTLHVVAASGMNVSLVASFVMGVFIRLLPRRTVALLVLGGIAFYAVLASLEPSIVRASVMGGLVFTASILNRATLAAWGLLLAGYSMLLFAPALLFDIGFQLSFAATGGLLFLTPLLEKSWSWFARVGKIAVIGDGFTTTLVAQAVTLPILLANFGTVSLLSILVNTLVLWTVQPVMVLGIVGAAASIVPVLVSLLLLATLPLLVFFETVVGLFNRPELLIAVKIPFLVGIGYYCLLIGIYFALKK